MERTELLAQVDLEALCQALDLQYEMEGDRLKVWCPFHNDNGRPNLSLGPGPLFHCFSCSAEGSIIDLIAYLNRTPISDSPKPTKREVAQAFERLEDYVERNPTLTTHPSRSRPTATPAPEPDRIDHVLGAEWSANLWTEMGADMLRYLREERGLSDLIIRTHSLGYDPVTARITIPVLNAQFDIVNVRKYKPHADKGVAKVISYARGYGQNRRMNLDAGRLAVPVLLCAGEMDYLVACNLGFAGADTFTAGEGTLPTATMVEDWKGQHVYICYDNDLAGKTGSKKLAEFLLSQGCIPHILDWSNVCHEDLPVGYDLSDFINVRGTAPSVIDQWIESTPPFDPTPTSAPPPQPSPAALEPSPLTGGFKLFDRTDVGNAIRLIARHGQDMRWCGQWDKWLVWDGRRWIKDLTGEARRRAMDTARSLGHVAAEEEDPDERKRWFKHGSDSHSAGRLAAMLSVAQGLPGVAIVTDELDQHPWLLNTQAATLDLQTGEQHPHSRDDLLSCLLPAVWQPGAPAPLWDAFLQRVLPDPALRAFVQRAAGYSTTGVIREHALFMLIGPGRNGKTILEEVLAAVLADYAESSSSEVFMAQRPGGIREDLARLRGARFVHAGETNEGRKLDVGVVKLMTGGDTITARFLHENSTSYVPQFKLWLRTNHRPVVKVVNDPIWSRLKPIPFDVVIPDEEQDLDLKSKLLGDTPGILDWLIQGCIDWREHGLGTADAITSATATYRAEMDPLLAFLQEQFVFTPEGDVRKTRFYEKYEEWAEQAHESVLSRTGFNRAMKAYESLGIREGANHAGQAVWRGVSERNGQHAVDR